jgi:CHRD domain
MRKQVILLSLASLLATSAVVVSCNSSNDNNVTNQGPVQLTATLTGQGVLPTATASAGTATLTGTIDRTTRVMSYSVSYAGLTPTSVGIYQTSSTTTGTPLVSLPGNATATTPGTGTATTPGTGTSTTPGTGTTTTPGTGTSTTPGTGTSTTPGTGTATTPGSGTLGSYSSPISGTVTLTQATYDAIIGGQTYVLIQSATYPNGELRGTLRAQ